MYWIGTLETMKKTALHSLVTQFALVTFLNAAHTFFLYLLFVEEKGLHFVVDKLVQSIKKFKFQLKSTK